MARGDNCGALPGNQNAKKLTTDELKKLAYKQYCEHLAKGKSKRSWYFDHPDLQLTARGFENYLENESEFPPKQREMAESKGYEKWEQIAEDSATGADKGRSNTASLQMVMRNKFGWDKEKREQIQTSADNDKAMKKLINHLNQSEENKSNSSESNSL